MSVQFGIYSRDGGPVEEEVLAQIQDSLVPYAPDGVSVLRRNSCALLFGSFATGRYVDAPQPYRLGTGDWLMWDGRLDSRHDLFRTDQKLTTQSTDLEIVARSCERLGTEVFSQLVGDWAISIFSEDRVEVLLARDFIGARPLFYSVNSNHVAWSTVIEPLVLIEGGMPKFSEAYIAGWLSSFPQASLTPYERVRSVPAASLVRLQCGKTSVRRYWDFDPAQSIRYRKDQDYEEHFRWTFREAVRRRIVSAKPVLAELSGGLDSSSIVCITDSVLASEEGLAPRLDTVTYFDNAEPNWDELPYARTVEEKRGRPGFHIDVGPESFESRVEINSRFRVVPTSPYARSTAADSFSRFVSERGYRAVLSGLGGDEMMGGVPTPMPELADLLVGLNATAFFRQSFAWALAKRKPLLGVWSTLLEQFLPHGRPFSHRSGTQLTWLQKAFVARTARHRHGPSRRMKLTGSRPSFQANLLAVESCRAQLSSVALESNPPYEWRYPFLDRDLVCFCLAVPREQMVRPRERRSLMRRSLAGVVPREILDRSRKAYVSRAPVKIAGADYGRLRSSGPLLSAELGIVDGKELARVVQNAEQGRDVATVPLLRTLALEDWLRSLRDYKKHGPEQASLRLRAARVVP
jgi:asparagine synthase (glutamine-hydrolysing)